MPNRGTIERRIRRILRAVFARFEGTALESVRGGEEFDYDALRTALQEALRPVLQNVTVAQALEIASEVGIGFDPTVINTAAARWARQYSFDLVQGLTDTTRQVLQDAVSAYIETPEMDLKELAKMLEPAFGNTRANMISVTETTRAYSEATTIDQRQLADEGLEMVRVWKTAADDLVCPVCAPLDEAPESVWANEFPNGPPAHINCRCGVGLTALPVEQLRERYTERQEYLRRELGAEWAGPEPGGNL